jgi:hypothetical protein
MRIGYARVSTLDHNPELQLEKLREAVCEMVIVEKAPRARARLVILLGQKKAVAIAVKNVSGRRRWSKLREWLNPVSLRMV